MLLASYLERRPTPPEAARLKLLVWLYDYVCLLWCELYSRLRPARSPAAAYVPGDNRWRRASSMAAAAPEALRQQPGSRAG